MAKYNLDFYSGEDLYSDGDIEQKILELVRRGVKLEDIDEPEFPIVYHLSRARENVLNWYPFKEKASVLEVGSGCGAITGMLCEKADKVVSVELSKRRADINYERNKKYDNLELIVGNINDVKKEEVFDYIVLNGVFEYAASFTDGDTPYETFLRLLAGRLNEQGRILIAIENRLGIKYFTGAPEDHTGRFFLGLNDYENEYNVRTFSKYEIVQLCEKAGVVCNKFFYPYPDYKFPNIIYTDSTVNKMGYGRDYYNYNENRFLLYNESAVTDSLKRENAADIFANSFLVEICKEAQEDERKIEYVKLNSDRADEFKIGTRIESADGKKFVYKYPLHEEAKAHLDKMYQYEQAIHYQSIQCVAGEKVKKEIKYPFIIEETLDDKVAKAIFHGNRDEIINLIDALFEPMFAEASMVDYRNKEFEKVFGKVKRLAELECVKPANIDVTCENVFCAEGSYRIIDSEWTFDFWIPKQFIVWRNLNELYGSHKELELKLPKKDFFLHYGIRDIMAVEFEEWNRYFTLCYVKANRMERYSVSKKSFDFEKHIKRVHEAQTALYIDRGQGYSEDTKMYRDVSLKDDTFEEVYEIDNPEGVRRLRWDPAENRFCACKVYVKAGRQEFRLKAVNADLVSEGRDVFLNSDPQYEIPDEAAAEGKLVIYGTLQYLDDEAALGFLRLQSERWEKKENYISRIEDTIIARDSEIKRLKQIIGDMENSKGWKLLEKTRKIKQFIRR